MSNKTGSTFGLLRNKTILAILDGDTSFGEVDVKHTTLRTTSGQQFISHLVLTFVSKVA